MKEALDKLYNVCLDSQLDFIFNSGSDLSYEHKIKINRTKHNQDNIFYRSDCDNIIEIDSINGLYKVIKDGQENLIDKDSNLLCDEWYDKIGEFKEDVACVSKNGKESYIDKSGKRITGEWFIIANDFSEGLASVSDISDNRFYIDKRGKHYDYGVNTRKWQGSFKCGRAPVYHNGKTAFIDKNGKVINNKVYEYAYEYRDGYAMVTDDCQAYYLIDLDGNSISTTRYSTFKLCDFGYIVKLYGSDDGYFVIDNLGNKIGNDDKTFANVDEFSEDKVIVERYGQYNLLRKDGSYVSNEWFTYLHYIKEIDCYEARYGPCYRILDHNGNLLNKEYFYGNFYFSPYYLVVHRTDFDNSYSEDNLLGMDGKLLFEKGFPHIGSIKNGLADVFKRKQGINSEHNLMNEKGELVLDKWLSYEPTREKISDQFIIISYRLTNKHKVYCLDTDMGEYKVEKKRTKYICTSKDDTFNIKYQPIRMYDSLVLCCNDKSVFLYDKRNNNYQTIGNLADISFDSNFIVDQKNRIVYLVYNNTLIDITDYYDRKLFGKNRINITRNVKIIDKNEFLECNEEEIIDLIKRTKEENRRILEKKQTDLEQKKLEEAKRRREYSEKEEAIKKEEAIHMISEGLETLNKYHNISSKIKRVKVKSLFEPYQDHYIIRQYYIDMGLLKIIDLNGISFKEVDISGIDFRGSNINLNPQEVYNQDLSGCNFEGIHITPFMNFSGVDIRGARFSDDDNSLTQDYGNGTFELAIYDGTTTYNGIPFNIIYGECQNTVNNRK